MLSGFPSACGYRRTGLGAADMLAGCYIVRYAETPYAEEFQQAAAFPSGESSGFQRSFLLKLVARRNAMSSLVSVHNHSPNAYIASPFTTVV